MSKEWDLILLDIMLPEMSGIDVLKRIRATESQTPVIMLTAKSEVEDKVKGLDLGANDYVTKPLKLRSYWHEFALHYGFAEGKSKASCTYIWPFIDKRANKGSCVF